MVSAKLLAETGTLQKTKFWKLWLNTLTSCSIFSDMPITVVL